MVILADILANIARLRFVGLNYETESPIVTIYVTQLPSLNLERRTSMQTKSILTVIAAVLLVSINAVTSNAQSPTTERKFEIGGQFSLLHVSTLRGGFTVFPCVVSPCPASGTFSESRVTEAGFGGRFGYAISPFVTLEAEGNFFPRDSVFEGGRKIKGLFGAKLGKRFEKVGLFAKARPGFIRYSKGDFGQRGGCIAVFPPPLGCFDSVGRTHFAFDLGGVVELYPSKRTVIRFDAGDTIIHFSERNVAITQAPFPQAAILRAPAATTHNFQSSFGFGFRF
jgi:hypothetical protein